MKRVIDGTRRIIRKGNDERVGEKQFNLLLAVESNERRLDACKCGCLSTQKRNIGTAYREKPCFEVRNTSHARISPALKYV
jgi:hypothetical protein